ncbi:MAG: hypothetical protein DI537_42405 [Stutzerimonas stutzeri]|nr:MAG: hypothetical protein DI537_42405 [Stutzerimonas stutzeri]
MNEARTRWYGLRVGDLVEELFGSVKRRGRVTELHTMDNNGCTVEVDGKPVKMVCEWCWIIEKVDA